MREIKFRVWFAGLMSYTIPSIQFNNQGVRCININHDPNDFSLASDTWADDHDEYVLMQYTGLKDKNGKEIYEGDICKCYDHPENIWSVTAPVKYEQGEWKIEGSIISLPMYGTAWTEVIGNIYENPDLLK